MNKIEAGTTDDVPEIEPDVTGATTLRKKLIKHREDASSQCHKKIDPAGFAILSMMRLVHGEKNILRVWKSTHLGNCLTERHSPLLWADVFEEKTTFFGV